MELIGVYKFIFTYKLIGTYIKIYGLLRLMKNYILTLGGNTCGTSFIEVTPSYLILYRCYFSNI